MTSADALVTSVEELLEPLARTRALAWWDSQVDASDENERKRAEAELAWSDALADSGLFLSVERALGTVADGSIRRTYRTASFKGTLMVINTIGHLAEAAWHHPDLLASYGSVEVRLSTHDANGITGKDFALARKIEDVVTWHPVGEGGLEGTPDDPRYAYVTRDA